MPPAKRKPRAPRAPRCSYIEDGRKCGSDGFGNPPLCAPHQAILRAAAEAPYNPFGSVVESIKNGRPVSVGDAVAAAADLIATMFGGRTYTPPPDQAAPRSSSAHAPPPGPGWDPFANFRQRASQPPPRADETAPARAAARKVFGWKPDHKFTGDELKARFRELAKKNHPDRGGSAEKMARVNHAMDVLTVELKSG